MTQVQEIQRKYPKGSVVLTTKNIIGVVEYSGTVSDGKTSVLALGVRVMDKKGNCNGSIRGKQYFECEENEGIFVPIKDVRKKISSRKLLEQLSQLQRKNKEYKAEIANLSQEIENIKRGDTAPEALDDGDDDPSILKFLK